MPVRNGTVAACVLNVDEKLSTKSVIPEVMVSCDRVLVPDDCTFCATDSIT